MGLLLKSFREHHVLVTDKTRATGKFVAEPDNQEQRNTDIGRHYAAPVDGIGQEGFVVLTKSNNQAQDEGENRPQREEA